MESVEKERPFSLREKDRMRGYKQAVAFLRSPLPNPLPVGEGAIAVNHCI